MRERWATGSSRPGRPVREARQGVEGLSKGDVEELKRAGRERRTADGTGCPQAIRGRVGKGGDEVSVARFDAPYGRQPTHESRAPRPWHRVGSVRTTPLVTP